MRLEKNENYEKSKYFLQQLSLNISDKDKPDFIHLRANPIYSVEEDKYMIISPLFVAEKIYKSLYFHLKDLNDRLPKEEKIANLRSFYGDDFTENFLLYKVLEYIYGQRQYIKFTGDELKKFNKGLPDYYIRTGNHIFLYENKDTYVPGDIKQSGDMEAILADLRSKLYYKVHEDDKVSPKAVQQLTENTRRILAHENKFDKDYKPDNVHIYPILVLNDSSFNTPGLNRIVNDWFRAELELLKQKGYKVDRVKRITIISIDTLILYSEFLKQKKISLNDLLIAYHRNIKFPKSKNVRSPNEAMQYFGNKNKSFAKFMDNYTNNGYKTLGKGLIGVAIKKIFPEDQTSSFLVG